MKLYNLVSEEDSLENKMITLEGDDFSADVFINIMPRTKEVGIIIKKLSYPKATAQVMTHVLQAIGKQMLKMTNIELNKEPHISDWSYEILSIHFDLGDIINKDESFSREFWGGHSSFNQHFVGRKKPLSDLYSDVIRGVLPWILDVPSIEKEYLKAKRRLEFIESEHFTEGEYEGYEYKTILNSPNIESNHRKTLSPNSTIDGKTIIINAYSLEIRYYTELVGNKKPEIETPSSWDKKLAKHVLRDYFVNGVYGIQTVYVMAFTNHNSDVSARTNEYHFNRDEII